MFLNLELAWVYYLCYRCIFSKLYKLMPASLYHIHLNHTFSVQKINNNQLPF